jgi:CubicO group peptidase (beta-lactamase class C family)
MSVATEVGIDQQKLRELLERARREVDEGLLPSCQIAVAREGKLVAFETIGEATNDTRYIIFSATKPFVASAVWLLLDSGDLSTDQRVAELVPEFGSNGKDQVTVEQVMLHTSGFPMALMNPYKWDDMQARLETFAEWKLEWEPGTQFVYHATSAHWVLAQIIEAITGTDFRVFLRETVIDPLGLGFRLGLAGDEQDGIAEIELCGEPMTPDELEEAIGIREIPRTEAAADLLVNLNDPAMREVGIPGGGGVGTAADIALFYQALLHNPGGLWEEELLRDATSRVRNSMADPLFGMPANRGLGVVIAGDDRRGHMRGFGKTSSPGTFGHGGAGGQIAWADPETGLSFGYVTNGLDEHFLRQARRGVGLSSRAAICAL